MSPCNVQIYGEEAVVDLPSGDMKYQIHVRILVVWRGKCQHPDNPKPSHGADMVTKTLESFHNNIKCQRPEHITNAAI